MTELVYRAKDGTISRRIVFTGISAVDDCPQGRMINHKGVDLGVRTFNKNEREAWNARTPGQPLIEMNKRVELYENVYDSARRLKHSRSSAPSDLLGRGDNHYSVVGMLPRRFGQQQRYGSCY